MPQLTRKEMEAVIASGGSVLWNGQTLWQAGQLPSAADLAAGDPAKEAAASADLHAQIAQLQADLAKLQPAAPAEATPAKPSKAKADSAPTE